MIPGEKNTTGEKGHLIPNGDSIHFQTAQIFTNLPKQRQAANVED